MASAPAPSSYTWSAASAVNTEMIPPSSCTAGSAQSVVGVATKLSSRSDSCDAQKETSSNDCHSRGTGPTSMQRSSEVRPSGDSQLSRSAVVAPGLDSSPWQVRTRALSFSEKLSSAPPPWRLAFPRPDPTSEGLEALLSGCDIVGSLIKPASWRRLHSFQKCISRPPLFHQVLPLTAARAAWMLSLQPRINQISSSMPVSRHIPLSTPTSQSALLSSPAATRIPCLPSEFEWSPFP